ncbi:MAG: NAD(P)H-dependent oxidoreductase [Planctomycetes bacterium]|nr:NAD(P)H-dependent oxidoreductase [Planctomycetota bacterium]MCB9935680.1 NAD(P)H-dependent oxidoreductase [Planctomycetota bacterium]
MPNILAFAGSLRAGSWNKKLVRIAAQGAREAGAEVNLIDLKEFPLPVYDADIEDAHGLPDNVHKLKDACKQAQGFLIASPEYNAGYSGVLKNLTDWLSRPREGEKAFEIFAMKPAAAMSASPGALGGNRMLASLRGHLLHLQMLVIPQTYGLSRASEAFDADGNLVDPKVEKRVKELGRIVAELAARLR